MASRDNDGIEDDVCVGYPEHRGVRETYRGDDGIQWECTVCGAEGWEDTVTSDGTEEVSSCCTDRCDGACGGYGYAFELAARNLRSIEDDLIVEAERGYDINKLVPRRVAFIGHPDAGKSELAGQCGEPNDGTEPPFEGEIPATARCCGTNICGTGIVGMFSLGGDLSRRAKDIARGTTAFSPGERDEALKRIAEEDAELLRRLTSNDGPVDGSSESAQ